MVASKTRAPESRTRGRLQVRALEPGDWEALEGLFGDRGACAGCWCMAWRLSQKQWEAGRGARNRDAFRRLVRSGRASGAIVLASGRAVGWCSAAPRADFAGLAGRPSLATDWDGSTWSVTCFFIEREWRGRGLGAKLLSAAVALARARGATRIEGYPVRPPRGGGQLPAAFAWTGLPQLFERCGFERLGKTPANGRSTCGGCGRSARSRSENQSVAGQGGEWRPKERIRKDEELLDVDLILVELQPSRRGTQPGSTCSGDG
jgi:GNAT superfamily N-acetyltransferase